ncbi:hypothetical protein [Rhizobium halophilum]|uniref:hypothetical protein n=1 Tax=Rhizobium halophilum TaxID=2846852 RepID=UPI001EFE7E48|nr:hypothetical protein [Rhizobium halophilum]MCF6371227.1 hypothetical protein [Rhizobium halophilum]
MARECGLEAAEATIDVAGKRCYLLLTGYDRFPDLQGEIRRLHQEELCQTPLAFIDLTQRAASFAGGNHGPDGTETCIFSPIWRSGD